MSGGQREPARTGPKAVACRQGELGQAPGCREGLSKAARPVAGLEGVWGSRCILSGTHRTHPHPLEYKGSLPAVTACHSVTHTPGTHTHLPTPRGTWPHCPRQGSQAAIGHPSPPDDRRACLGPMLARGVEGHMPRRAGKNFWGMWPSSPAFPLGRRARPMAYSSASASPPTQWDSSVLVCWGRAQIGEQESIQRGPGARGPRSSAWPGWSYLRQAGMSPSMGCHPFQAS